MAEEKKLLSNASTTQHGVKTSAPSAVTVTSSEVEQLVNLGYNPDTQRIKNEEFPYLNRSTYLDHSGATLYPTSLIDTTAEVLKATLLGNPHSGSPSSQNATKIVNEVREQILRDVFNADPEHFDVVFCANATAAVKIVGEAFSGSGGPWKPGFVYRFHRDCHTSLVGVRELVSEVNGGAWGYFGSDEGVTEWLSPTTARERKARNNTAREIECRKKEKDPKRLKLFAYPAQSNLTGQRLPQTWAKKARDVHGYYTLLDAAALLMTKNLDLSDVESAPDFVVCSWYKVFGMPDLGSLIIKKSSLNAVDIWRRRRYYGGGTVASLVPFEGYRRSRLDNCVAGPGADTTSSCSKFHETLEDGSLAFHSILTLGVAIRNHTRLFGSLSSPAVSLHCAALAHFLFEKLSSLRHASGVKLVEFYPSSQPAYLQPEIQGPVLAFNIRSSSGRYVGFSKVEELATAQGINIRVGGNCNPGGVQYFGRWTDEEFKILIQEMGKECGDEMDIITFVRNGKKVEKPIGLVRVSLGAVTTLEDVMTFWNFLKKEFLNQNVDHSVEVEEEVVEMGQASLEASEPSIKGSIRFPVAATKKSLKWVLANFVGRIRYMPIAFSELVREAAKLMTKSYY